MAENRSTGEAELRLVLPIWGVPGEEVAGRVAAEVRRWYAVELWLDTLRGLELPELTALAQRFPHRLICVWDRGQDPGGRHAVDGPRLTRGLAASPLFIDLDLVRQQELFGVLPAGRACRLIASHHDYDETPDDCTLRRVARDLQATRAEVIKIATTCRNRDDARRLLALQRTLVAEGVPSVVLGMGEHGARTRVEGPACGGAWVYAPEDPAKASAPGQLTRAEIEQGFAALRRERARPCEDDSTPRGRGEEGGDGAP